MKKIINKKILIIAVIAIILLLLCSGVAYALGVFEKQAEPIIGEYDSKFVDQYVSEKISDIGNIDVPNYNEDDLLFENECFVIGRDAGSFTASGFRTDFFERIVKMFPDPLVREIDNYIYIIYDTDNGTRLYLFFSKDKNESLFMDGFPIIVKDKLTYEDFSNLNVGDDIQKIQSIDPITSLYLKKFDRYTDAVLERNEKAGFTLTSVHLLSDGIMKIEYERVDSGYVIKNIIYNPDFILDGANGRTCYKILDKDYVS